MALTREMLKGMGLTEEQVSAIIGEHVNVTTGLKDQIKELKAEAEKVPNLQKELDDIKSTGGNWETKYKTEHEAFEKFKADTAAKELTAKVKSAYAELLKENKVGDKYINTILNVTDFKSMELGDDGKLKDIDKLSQAIQTDYSGFVVSTETHGAGTETPPGSNGAMTKEAFEKLSLSERMTYANEHPGEVSSFLK